jgi:hypothetical protein
MTTRSGIRCMHHAANAAPLHRTAAWPPQVTGTLSKVPRHQVGRRLATTAASHVSCHVKHQPARVHACAAVECRPACSNPSDTHVLLCSLVPPYD